MYISNAFIDNSKERSFNLLSFSPSFPSLFFLLLLCSKRMAFKGLITQVEEVFATGY